MPRVTSRRPERLEDLPNIGKAITQDLRRIGIDLPEQLENRDPLVTYRALSSAMGHRLDPCVLYTLMAVQHYLDKDEALPWWKFTEAGKKLLHPI